MKPTIPFGALFLITFVNAIIVFTSVALKTPPVLPHLFLLVLSIVIAIRCLIWQPYFLHNIDSPDPEISIVLIIGTTFVACMLAFRYAVNIFIHIVWMKFAVIAVMALIATGISYYFFARSSRTDRIKDGH